MILEARDLWFSYGAEPVLKGVDVRVRPGVTAVIGPNAAGKSTLLKCLCGQLEPRGGVWLDDREAGDIPREELTAAIGYLPQDLSSRAALTVFEFVLLGRLHRLRWRAAQEDLDAVERVLAEQGLAALAGRQVGELSGGQMQMVGVAQVLAREPGILVLDEPTSNLDLEHQFQIGALIRGLAESRGISVAIALHDLNVAARFADAVYVLKEGALYAAGTPAEVLTAEIITAVYRVNAQVVMDADGRPLITPLGPSAR